jgi:hypothetical protein
MARVSLKVATIARFARKSPASLYVGEGIDQMMTIVARELVLPVPNESVVTFDYSSALCAGESLPGEWALSPA